MAQRQPNIRGDEASERARCLASRLGKTTTEVVAEALRALEATIISRDGLDLHPTQRTRPEAIVNVCRGARKEVAPKGSFDDSRMRDGNGRPR